jgi:hypothetical protein
MSGFHTLNVLNKLKLRAVGDTDALKKTSKAENKKEASRFGIGAVMSAKIALRERHSVPERGRRGSFRTSFLIHLFWRPFKHSDA